MKLQAFTLVPFKLNYHYTIWSAAGHQVIQKKFISIIKVISMYPDRGIIIALLFTNILMAIRPRVVEW